LSKGLLLAIDEKEYRLLEIVSHAVREMSEGELVQIQKSRRLNITEEEYFEIIRKKTATLIIACTTAGASSVTDDAGVIGKLKEYGEHAGIAFQIKDDIFDYQKKGITGKPVANDIKEKKLTLPLIYALSRATRQERAQVLKLVKSNNNSSRQIGQILDFVEKKKGLEYAIEKMEDHKNKAIAILNDFPDNQAKKSLIDLAGYIIQRNS
jgi:octaprenyl-diphosphate synthase